MALFQAQAESPRLMHALYVPDSSGSIMLQLEHRFASPIAPVGEANLFRHVLGMDNPGNTEIASSYLLNPRYLASLGWESRLQTAA